MTPREIGISIIIGLVFYFVGRFVLYWVPLGYIGSMLLSIAGAVALVFIIKKIRGQKSFTAGHIILSALFGGGIVLFAARMLLVPDHETIIIDCTKKTAYRDPASVNRKGDVVWKVKGGLNKNFEVTFLDQNAPFNEPGGGYKKKVRGNTQSNPEIAENLGFFRYQFVCSDGAIVDPMLFIPRP